MKLYAVSDGPPSLSCRMTLKALGVPFELVNVDYCRSEHMTDDYAKVIKNNI
jgi:glutathione S-transferase